MARPARPVGEASEQALLDAAARAFARDGYHAASLNEILQAAGWAKSSLYHYFDGKKGLHDHVVTVLSSRLGDELTVPKLGSLSAAEFWPAMAALLDDFQRAAAEHPETRQLGLMYHRDDSAEADSVLNGLRTDLVSWLSRAVRRGRTLGLVRRDIPTDLAVELTVAVLGVLDRWTLDRYPRSSVGIGRLPLSLIQDLIATHQDAR